MNLNKSRRLASNGDNKRVDAEHCETEGTDLPLSTRLRSVIEIEHQSDPSVLHWYFKSMLRTALQCVACVANHVAFGAQQRHRDGQRLGNGVIDGVRRWTLFRGCTSQYQ